MKISRLELLDCLGQISILFKLLFSSELENSQQYNIRVTFLRQFIELEGTVVSLCEHKGIKPTDDFEMSELGAKLLEKKAIGEEMLEAINEISEFAAQLIPEARVAELTSETYEVVQKLSECLDKLHKIQ